MATRSGRGLRAALVHRDYRFVLAASSISQTGDWLYNVALLVWVYDSTHSATWVAVVTVARLVPYVVVGPVGGLVADSYDRRTVLIVSDLVRAGLMFGLAAVTSVDGPVGLAAALACLTTAAGTAYRPAIVAMLPEIVGEGDLAAANATESVVENLAVVLGPALGAGLLLLGSPDVRVRDQRCHLPRLGRARGRRPGAQSGLGDGSVAPAAPARCPVVPRVPGARADRRTLAF